MRAVVVSGGIEAPWGPVNVAISTAGVVAVELFTPQPVFLEELGRRVDGTVTAASGARLAPGLRSLLERTIGQLEQYLSGEGRAFDVPLDLAMRPAWDRNVLAAVRDVPWGEVASYGEIALAIGRAGAARAVGGAVGRNPIAIIVPCHRVIAGDGSLGVYGGDGWGSRDERLSVKRDLLALEGRSIERRQERGIGRIG